MVGSKAYIVSAQHTPRLDWCLIMPVRSNDYEANLFRK